MYTLKNLSIILVFIFIKNSGFAQTASLNNLSSAQTQTTVLIDEPGISIKLSEAQQLKLEQLESIKISTADSLISYDGIRRIATPNKKIALEKP